MGGPRKLKINFEDVYFDGDIKMCRKKEAFIKAYMKCLHIQKACDAAEIGRRTFYRYKDDDKEFRELVDLVDQKVLDDAEKSLRTASTLLDTQATKFLLQKKGISRGYGEIPIQVEGGIVIKWAEPDEDKTVKEKE